MRGAHSRVVRDTGLWGEEPPEGREIETKRSHPTTGKLYLSTQQ